MKTGKIMTTQRKTVTRKDKQGQRGGGENRPSHDRERIEISESRKG